MKGVNSLFSRSNDMLIVSYDFENDKTRTQFSTFLKQYGRRLQYSVYEIKNSPRILKNVMKEVELRYKPRFTNSDSVLIYSMCKSCDGKMVRYGYPVNEEQEVVVFE
jgi:CRISPR-associated protein Cas2